MPAATNLSPFLQNRAELSSPPRDLSVIEFYRTPQAAGFAEDGFEVGAEDGFEAGT